MNKVYEQNSQLYFFNVDKKNKIKSGFSIVEEIGI